MRPRVRNNYYKHAFYICACATIYMSVFAIFRMKGFIDEHKILNYSFFDTYGYYISISLTPIVLVFLKYMNRDLIKGSNIIKNRLIKTPQYVETEYIRMNKSENNKLKIELKIAKDEIKKYKSIIDKNTLLESEPKRWETSLTAICIFYSDVLKYQFRRINDREFESKLKCRNKEFKKVIEKNIIPGKEPLGKAIRLAWEQWPDDLKFLDGAKSTKEERVQFLSIFDNKTT